MPSTTPHTRGTSRFGKRLGGISSRRAWLLGTTGLLVIAGLVAPRVVTAWTHPVEARSPRPTEIVRPVSVVPAGADSGVLLSVSQQEAISLEIRPVEAGELPKLLKAPGQITPDQGRYAFITPRAAGVVRSVEARVGQEVKAGDLLAVIDSPEVAQARLDLVTRLQAEEITRASADWQEQIHQATADLIAMLRAGQSPEEIQAKLADRDVGPNLDRLMTAYSRYRLANNSYNRSLSLRASNAVSVETHQQAVAEHEAALASYKAAIESIEFQSRIEYSQARQALRQAETAVKVARARLRVLGVPADGHPNKNQALSEAQRIEGSSVVTDAETARTELEHLATIDIDQSTIGTYSLWAPFDGTIIDRDLVVPGVPVDTTHRIFQLADLSKVWVEVKVREADFGQLVGQDHGQIQFSSPAYPGKTFPGRVIYTGDLVDQKTRAILLLAEAENPERLLKPGMFVEVRVQSPEGRPAAFVPESAILTEGNERFVYVRQGPERFARRVVKLGDRQGERVAVLEGLEVGEEVVVRGAFKLKAAGERQGEASRGDLVARVAPPREEL